MTDHAATTPSGRLTRVELRRGAYHDSVTLMQLSRAVAQTPGVSAAQVAMATELNIEVLSTMGFAVPDEAGPNDLVIAVAADSAEAVAAGVEAAEAALAATRRRPASGGMGSTAVEPLTLGSAVRRSEANLVVISVPGASAATEAFDAIDSGASVMLFSDNVPVEQEVALKDAGAAAGVLVMGPDCGTAVVGGIALGFANVGRRDVDPTVGLVAASGTGAQQVMCLLDAAGLGVTHCLGVGGRDLGAAVAGRSTRQALAALDADPQTRSIVIVSKPADPAVLADLQDFVASLDTPVRWATLGAGRPDLTTAVEDVLRAEGRPVPEWPVWAHQETPVSGSLRGLFCGGTLADEAMLVAQESLGPIRSNIPLSPELALGPGLASVGHTVIDFGDDQMTRGRAHPMIDPSLRLERIAAEADDPSCGVLLLDLVLGYGSHPDPGGELAAAIAAARHSRTQAGGHLPVVVSLTGTLGDPQDFDAVATALHAAGASVYLSNAAATRHAVSLLEGSAS